MPDIPATSPISKPDARSPDAKAAAPTSNNSAANGYWVHDASGPRHYVAPPAGQPATDADVTPLVRRIEAALADLGTTDASGITAAFEADQIVLTGFARSAAARSTALAAVRQAAGDVRVTDRIAINESLPPLEPTS